MNENQKITGSTPTPQWEVFSKNVQEVLELKFGSKWMTLIEKDLLVTLVCSGDKITALMTLQSPFSRVLLKVKYWHRKSLFSAVMTDHSLK